VSPGSRSPKPIPPKGSRLPRHYVLTAIKTISNGSVFRSHADLNLRTEGQGARV
jgi:hypothetical protein